MPRLRIVAADGVEQTVALHGTRLKIGRSRDNDIILPGAEKGVSRLHAELRCESGQYVIVDLQSQNGTWVNGRRIDRADVVPGVEIAVGEYRLMLEDDSGKTDGLPTVRGIRPDAAGHLPVVDQRAAEAVTQPMPRLAPPPRKWLAGVAVALVVTAVGAVAWLSRTGDPGSLPEPSSIPAAAATPSTPPRMPREGSAASPEPLPGPAPLPSEKGDAVRVRRRPGESGEAWRARAEALEMRYGYSKAALDRGDFSAAAGGFEAILLEEPGFLDAPALLVQAQAGLRANASGLFEEASRLEARRDWPGAFQKYEQARLVNPALPGLAERMRFVREKLHAAGRTAFNKAKQHEASGRIAEAVLEYERALQWLPVEDPNRQVARARLGSLKKN